jgi:3-oxoadipate enol-lactonase
MWNARIKAVADGGIASIADPVLERWFSPAFRKTRKDEFAIYSNMLVRTPREGYVACCEAIRDADFTPHAARLAAPALCIAGEHDGATPPDLVRDTAGRISNARFELIKDAAHLPCIEQPETYAMLINAFANTLP